VDLSLLVPTLVGGLLALGGGFAGQWWAERRAVERESRAWAREQKARSHEAAREAYRAFLRAFDEHLDLVMRRPEDIDFTDWDWARALEPLVTDVRLFGTSAAAEFADSMHRELVRTGDELDSIPPAEMGSLYTLYLAEVRRDLGVEVPQ
jgi:phytoene dehydrogenase-like protein